MTRCISHIYFLTALTYVDKKPVVRSILYSLGYCCKSKIFLGHNLQASWRVRLCGTSFNIISISFILVPAEMRRQPVELQQSKI
jgi:hypothetical protein